LDMTESIAWISDLIVLGNTQVWKVRRICENLVNQYLLNNPFLNSV
jgi:hypothetical protein